MLRVLRACVASVGAVGLLVGSATPASAAPRPFQAVDLGSLSPPTDNTGLGYSSASAINDRGVTVGTATAPDGSNHGVRWRPNGTIRDLGVGLYPADINNRGTIVGSVGQSAGASSYGFVWRDGAIQSHIDLPGPAFKINEHEQMLLERPNPLPAQPTYFFRDTDGVVTEFPPGHELNDLNNLGQVIGTVRGATAPASRGFVWQAHVGIIRDFGPASEGRLINDKGHVVRSEIAFCEECGGHESVDYFYKGRTRRFVTGGRGERVLAINDKDQVVGSSASLGGDLAAWFWTPKSGRVNLQRQASFDGEIAARDINESTQIVGASQFAIRPDGEGGLDWLTRATRWAR